MLVGAPRPQQCQKADTLSGEKALKKKTLCVHSQNEDSKNNPHLSLQHCRRRMCGLENLKFNYLTAQ